MKASQVNCQDQEYDQQQQCLDVGVVFLGSLHPPFKDQCVNYANRFSELSMHAQLDGDEEDSSSIENKRIQKTTLIMLETMAESKIRN